MPQGIYAIENTETGDVYIGSTRALAKRKRRHFRELKQGIHHSTYLQRAYAKYGESVFVFRVIEEVLDKNMLIPREQYWIETLHPTYNMNPLATNSLGMKVSEETKRLLLQYSLNRTTEERRLDQLGKKRSPETRRKLSEKAFLRTHTEASKQKMRDAKLERKLPEETRQKMSDAHMGKTPSEETRQKIAEGNKRFNDNITEEQKQIRSEKARNRPPVSEETRRKQSEAAKHRKRKPQT